VEGLSSPDVLLIPVGGVSTIDATTAMETISLLQPKLVIPMHFGTEAVKMELEPVERFLREMGIKGGLPEPKLVVTKSSLPEETKVVVLDWRE
jgi:L-ascorbate metabolism protein UlaG (beta-lactamase superfamily)